MKKTIALFMASSAMLCGGANAETFPSHAVTLVVPFAPGGSSDAISRVVAQALGKKWRQSVIVDNRAGGQTTIGTGVVARSPADGYTILYNSYAWSTNQYLIKDLPYKQTDLKPVTLLGISPLALLVGGNLPVNTLAEFVAYAKKSAKPISIGNAGVGSSSHLAALEFADIVGIKIIPVPYKSGTIGAINDVLGGQIDAVFEGRTFKPYVDAKRLKALVAAQPERMVSWKEIPDSVEAGYPTLNVPSYFGLMVPAKTPTAIQNQIASDVGGVLRDPQVRDRLLSIGLEPRPQTPAEFGAFLQVQHDKLKVLVARHKAELE
jgi:tripartite-type tricarboxylate transporter receptor subunit TctC